MAIMIEGRGRRLHALLGLPIGIGTHQQGRHVVVEEDRRGFRTHDQNMVHARHGERRGFVVTINGAAERRMADRRRDATFGRAHIETVDRRTGNFHHVVETIHVGADEMVIIGRLQYRIFRRGFASRRFGQFAERRGVAA